MIIQYSHRSLKSRYVDENINLPESYNFLDEFKQCDFGPLNQECGICYAYGPIKTMSHRICRATGKQIILSVQYLAACDLLNVGCSGGCSRSVFLFLEKHGTTDITCHPWKNISRFSYDFCSKCPLQNSSQSFHLYKTVYGSTRQLSTPEQIKKEIYIKGPVTASVITDDQMRYYKEGIYTRYDSNIKTPPTHTVEIVGWGKEKGQEYWIVSNSYGENWGKNGKMKIRMGHNDALIESYVLTADPEINL